MAWSLASQDFSQSWPSSLPHSLSAMLPDSENWAETVSWPGGSPWTLLNSYFLYFKPLPIFVFKSHSVLEASYSSPWFRKELSFLKSLSTAFVPFCWHNQLTYAVRVEPLLAAGVYIIGVMSILIDSWLCPLGCFAFLIPPLTSALGYNKLYPCFLLL